MIYLLAADYPEMVEQLNGLDPGDPNFANQVAQISTPLQGRWFGLDEGLAQGAANPQSSYTAALNGAQLDTPTNLIHNPDPHGPTAVMNLNNMARGLFTYPSAGAMLWVFFREGNPLFPVYFAANYGQREWQSAYRYTVASPAKDTPGYKPAASELNKTISTSTLLNFGAGAIRVENTTVPDDPTKDEKSFGFFSEDGSNMFFNQGYHQIFSKFDRRDQTEGDKWETTLGYKEQLVNGDYNKVILGDYIVKIGNISSETVEAVEKIQASINRIMEPLAKSESKC